MKNLHPVTDRRPSARMLEHWRNVRWFIEVIWNLFGGPETIAELRNVTRKDHQLLASWLRKAEILVRKILLIEAAEAPIGTRVIKPRKRAPRVKKLREFYAHEPHTWRVSFRLGACGSRAVSGRRSYGPGFVCPDSWPLALRFEALTRVFDCPEPYIARLARRLRRLPSLIARLAAPAPAECAGYEEIYGPVGLLTPGAERRLLSDTS